MHLRGTPVFTTRISLAIVVASSHFPIRIITSQIRVICDYSMLDDLIKDRTRKLNLLKEKGVDPYPARTKRTHEIKELRKDFTKFEKAKKKIFAVGRVMSVRDQGGVLFVDLKDESGTIQAVFKKDTLKDFSLLRSALDRGDFLSVGGVLFKTKKGEESIDAKTVQMLSKSLRPLPTEWYGLKDKEERFRSRHVDLLLNKEVKELMDKRWSIERAIREFLWSERYAEVETPILQNLYGGTNARPFTTHVNALDIEMYLRVAPELYLKRLVVGGYERIFEIARNFRNEGLDQTHQPEFTMLELYEAYADYYRIMDLTEAMIKHVAKKVNGTLSVQVGDHRVNLAGKWKRITIDEAMKKYLGIDWASVSEKEIKKILEKNKFTVPGLYTREKALFIIFDHLVPPHLIEPTWVIDYPREVSPLSRMHDTKPGRVERFEGYVGGKEICDGWSEITSPLEQRSRFESEQKNLKAGDEEAQPLDEDFIEALGAGCPPLGGIGVGVDRLVMFLTNTWSIREIIPFPLMRPKGN